MAHDPWQSPLDRELTDVPANVDDRLLRRALVKNLGWTFVPGAAWLAICYRFGWWNLHTVFLTVVFLAATVGAVVALRRRTPAGTATGPARRGVGAQAHLVGAHTDVGWLRLDLGALRDVSTGGPRTWSRDRMPELLVVTDASGTRVRFPTTDVFALEWIGRAVGSRSQGTVRVSPRAARLLGLRTRLPERRPPVES